MDETKLQLLMDRTAIHDLILRYATAVDMRDWAMYGSCFTDRIDIDLTSFAGGEPGSFTRDQWVDRVSRGINGYAQTQHVNTNFTITVDGDSARCHNYIHAQHRVPYQGDHIVYAIIGYYDWTLERAGGEWKIRAMTETARWLTGDRELVTRIARERFESGEYKKQE